MGAIRLTAFGGMIPLQDPRLLPDNFASHAENTVLYSGVLQGFRYPRKIRDLVNTAARVVYRIPEEENVADIDANSTWLEFTDINTTVVKSAVQGDTYRRFYWTSPSGAPRYNSYARIVNGDPSYVIGIPAPDTAPGVVVTGGVSSVVEARSYVYTWVSAFGEEGPPSPPYTVETGKVDASYALTLTAPTVGQLASRNISKVRIYRTITSNQGVTTYFQVTEQDYTDTTYTDTTTTTVLSRASQLQSQSWTPPPNDLDGLIQLPNGILAGFTGQDVYFSVAYRPHAWPAGYIITVDHPIVGLGVVGNSVIVCTKGNPAVISGSSPASMTMSKIEASVPCLSRRSIVSSFDGVYYASKEGIVRIAPGDVSVVSTQFLSRQDWASSYYPEYLNAVRFRTGYMGWIRNQSSSTAPNRGFLFDPSDSRLAMTLFTDMLGGVRNLVGDPHSAEVLVIAGDAVWLWDPTDVAEQVPFVWTSKEIQTPRATNFAVMQVFLDEPGSKTIADSVWHTVYRGMIGYELAIIRLFADGREVMVRRVVRSGELIRLPSGFTADFWRVEITARSKVFSIQMASTAKELAGV